jgi:hypothetical protein
MYSSANHISPTIAAGTRAWPICLPGKLSYDPLGSRVRAAASVREYAVNGRPYASRKRRPGAERAAEDSTLVQLLGHKDWPLAEPFPRSQEPNLGKPSLTVFRCRLAVS